MLECPNFSTHVRQHAPEIIIVWHRCEVKLDDFTKELLDNS
jgi:hypothetical protein